MFVFDMVDMFDMFVFRKRSGQYLHVRQGEHLLWLLERNLHDTGIIVWRWWRWWRWWRLIVSCWHHFMMTRIVVGVMSWWRLWREIEITVSWLSQL